MRQRLERKISFLSLFYIYFCHPHFSLYSFYFFGVFPHFSIRIRIRDPQVSGPRFTDTSLDAVNSEQCFEASIVG